MPNTKPFIEARYNLNTGRPKRAGAQELLITPDKSWNVWVNGQMCGAGQRTGAPIV